MVALLFPIPSGSIIYVVSPYLVVALGLVIGYAEFSGYNLGYSKFAGSNKLAVPSKVGMFLMYFPADLISSVFLAYGVGFLPGLLESCGASGVASLLESKPKAVVATSDTRLLLVVAAVFINFSKRSLEVLFVHKFSGQTDVGSSIFICSYMSSAVGLLLFTQVKSTDLAPPSLDLKWLGLATYLVGLTGNGYHHWLLSRLRKDGSKKYVVPQGGLFGLLVCPHYVFEMITYVGIALMSQTWVACATTTAIFFYLTARTIKTKQWYMKKVDGFPEERSVLIPGVF